MALSPDFAYVLLPLVNLPDLFVLCGKRNTKIFLVSLEEEKCNILLGDENELWGAKEVGEETIWR